ncbi:ABC transporter ATP-binding protein [Roseibacterium beibuensis]|uniref:ABC transporter ATP-binding protein n=1 Tax=[Roseibacterium] beibuensis TaxID=1193142 RepID=UPI00217E8EF4|nr:ABC transporter ATP-binding protein [Roseibacterium beibuensis]MCS6625337.1 ABC transporter ATP-binding protein [Roseibacterium beibuensis]
MSKAPRKTAAAASKGQGTPVLSVRGVTRTYDTATGGLTVLKGVDLDVMPGEVVGLIGPSGSGKSSLLHAAGLLERPTSGDILIDGRDVGDLPERARTHIRLASIGFVYQFHHLLAEFDARDNVALPLRIAGVNQTDARARASEVLTALGLGERLTHQPAQMSGGEQQRVAVARALANRPRLLLADEPTGNLDPATSQTVFEALHDLVKKTGVAALIATHNMELAGHMDRVFALKDGHLEERPAESHAY